MDKWILDRLHRLIDKSREAFEEYEFHVPVSSIHSFCVNELSSFYLDISKDRLYVEDKNSLTRRSAQTAMFEILTALTKLLAPVLSFTSEEIWQEMKLIDKNLPESVFLSEFPEQDKSKLNDDLNNLWNEALILKGAVSRALETMRAEKIIGTSLEAAVEIKKSKELERLANSFTNDELADIVIVSSFKWQDSDFTLEKVFKDSESGIELSAGFTKGTKCPRCWKYSEHSDENGLCLRCSEVLKK